MADQEMQQAASGAGQTMEMSEFEALLTKEFKPKSDTQKESVSRAVQTLAQQVMAEVATIPEDAEEAIESIIAELDKKISQQVDQILHNEDFQKLEGTWRGLSYLVNNTETDEKLKIKVFKQIYEKEFGTPGGEPYGCLIGDYAFNHTAPDVAILEGIGQIAASAHAPFITSPDPSLLNLDSWQELHKPRDLTKIFGTAEYAAWRSLRDSADSQYLAMAMPRTLARMPYGPNSNPVEEFNYEEDTGAADHSRYTWSNAAYAMGVNINRAFKLYGWCTAIRGVENGGIVEGLPVHTFPTDDGGVDMKCPTEVAITDRREAELSRNGFLPLCHYKNTDYAVFFGGQSLQKPAEYDDPDATSNANLAARLPYTFATCRFAHYLKCIVRDKLGSFAERADMEKFLNNWIAKYVVLDPSASQAVKARHPLSAAEVVVEEVEGNPGYYSSKFFLKPHYQLEGLTVSLRLVSKLPSAKS